MPIKGHDKSKLFLTSALTAILTLAMLMLSAPNVKAADVDTYAFINVTPNPVGQGQSAFVIAWLDWYPPTAAGAQGDRWRNITITVWKPDGSSETMGPFTSDPVGIVYFEYTPTQVGTYQFQMHFPGQVLQLLNGSSMGLPYVGSYFKPSTSSKATLTVQAEPFNLGQQLSFPQVTGNARSTAKTVNGASSEAHGSSQTPTTKAALEGSTFTLRRPPPRT
jgi:hypothetical protein